jgi:hypothetical protein
MGLYQYIREQEHRNDLVGELGSWMSKHYGERPDHSSLAFELASKEFAACGNWTRQQAVEQLNENKKFQRILKIEPRISVIISEAIKIRANQGYSRDMEYNRFKAKISKLVGYETEKDELGDSDSYNIILQVVVELLPPDVLDLYPNGLYDESLELDL